MVKATSSTKVQRLSASKVRLAALPAKRPALKRRPGAINAKAEIDAAVSPAPHSSRETAVHKPRPTKKELVTTLLRRDGGIPLAEVMQATGWLAHSVRAALTGLRKDGYDVVRGRDADGQTTYWIGSSAQ